MTPATPFLVLARGLLGLLIIEAPVAFSATSGEYTDAICDDGGPVYDEDGQYRKDCTHQGCGLNDSVCYYGDYFERCLDATGAPTGQCQTTEGGCSGRLDCLWLWIDCTGQYQCNSATTLGCKEGTCTE